MEDRRQEPEPEPDREERERHFREKRGGQEVIEPEVTRVDEPDKDYPEEEE